MEFTTDFAAAQSSISAALVNTTRAASRLSVEDIAFHRSSDATVASLLDRENTRLLSLVQNLLRSAASVSQPVFPDVDSIDGNWGAVVDTVDSLLERSDTCLDEYNGRFKHQITRSQADSPAPKARAPRKLNHFRSDNIPKPQLLFDHPPENKELGIFRPLLSRKPHALDSLEQSLTTRETDEGTLQFRHPYESEINQYQYPSSMYTKAEPISYLPFESTQATFVDTFEGVLEMLEELKAAPEIAIDLEHHDTHSYIGIVSLMQISTRNRDWIVDTLKPWRRKLEVLNEVFADPSILKILHGAHMDIMWLQRDLGLYIVGLFDTHHASRVLGYAGGSLAFLLKKFVDFDAQKQYQTADWRIRPLPLEMFDYARSDTHFLLFVYDHIRNDLVDRSGEKEAGEDCISAVLDKSKVTALQRYERFNYDVDENTGRGGWFALIQNNPTVMSKEQFAVFRQVHQWRDMVARQEDEGVHHVMPNHVVFSIARALPVDLAALLSVSHPISQAVRVRASELLSLVRSSVEGAAAGPSMTEKVAQILQANPMLVRRRGVIPSMSIADPPRSEEIIVHPALPSGASIRTNASSFWGSTLENDARTANTVDTFGPVSSHLALPVPLSTVSGFAGGSAGKLSEQLRPQVDEIVPTSTDRLGKRKADTSDDYAITAPRPLPSDVDLRSTTTETVDAEAAAEKARRLAAKAERKAAKLARKAQKSNELDVDRLNADMTESGGAETASSFDYGSAPSVLHAPKGSSGYTAKNPPFNPFAKSANAQGGLGRTQEYRSGKSTTFKH